MNRIVRFELSFAIVMVVLVQASAMANQSDLKTKMKQTMQQNPQLIQEMMANPDHRLAMGYRDNLLNFAQVLKRAAQASETVSGDFTRTAVGEMRRSIDLLEKTHDRALGSITAEKKALLDDIPQLVHEHLSDVRKRLDHLDQLAKKDQAVSKDVLNDLNFIDKHCRMAMKGMHHESGHRNHHDLQGMNDRDAELESLVQRMNQVSEEEKVGVMAEILTRLVAKQKEMKLPMQGETPYGMHPMMHRRMNHNFQYPGMPDDDPDMNMDDEMDMEELE